MRVEVGDGETNCSTWRSSLSDCWWWVRRTLAAQPALAPQAPAETVDLSGPRFGVTFLNGGLRDTLADAGIDVGPAISQFGWQKEKRFLSSPNGFTGVTEWVILFGGMDQGTVLPSFSWLVGHAFHQGG